MKIRPKKMNVYPYILVYENSISCIKNGKTYCTPPKTTGEEGRRNIE